MPIYLYRITPPRPTFPADITAAEGAAMERHFGYWHEQLGSGRALVFGPVADPAGAYGIAILTCASEAEAGKICANDPAVTAELGFTFEVFEMPDAVAAGAGA